MERLSPVIKAGLARAEAMRVQRERQQGLSKPIISTVVNGTRFVAVKNRLMHSKGWGTFADFLGDYLKTALGSDWGNAELAKPPAEQHPILTWYKKLCEHQLAHIKEVGKPYNTPMTGAVAAYMHLAYDLYALDHNAELQEKLLARLRHLDQFTGARYEIFVAAVFIRAGFDIEFEDEGDGNTRHCEFTATCRMTGKKFSVEAKRREGRRPRIGHLFNDALDKAANHPRVVFIDMNMRQDGPRDEFPSFMNGALRRIRQFDGAPLNGKLRPPAYVFVTNMPFDLHLDAPAPKCPAIVEGFQIPDFKGDVKATLREVINARKKHIEMHTLMQSIQDHNEIPATFDGSIAEYAFYPERAQIIIGQRYLVPEKDGVKKPATVTSATVSESERVAYCAVTFDDGHSAIVTFPLDEEELDAWRRHPDTFFGELGQRKHKVNGPLEMYDFLLDTYRKSSKEQLLKLMAAHLDIEHLATLDQPTLADIYSERCALAFMAHTDKRAAPALDIGEITPPPAAPDQT